MGSSFGHPCSNTEPRPGWTSHWMRPPECEHARPVGKPAGQHAHSGETAKHSLRLCTLRTVEDNGIRLIIFNTVVQLFHRNLPIAGFFFGGVLLWSFFVFVRLFLIFFCSPFLSTPFCSILSFPMNLFPYLTEPQTAPKSWELTSETRKWAGMTTSPCMQDSGSTRERMNNDELESARTQEACHPSALTTQNCAIRLFYQGSVLQIASSDFFPP